MPLLDHFHQPIDPRVGWESFHHRWANAIADHLDQQLPRQFFARVEIHLGNEVATAIEVRSADPTARLLAVIEFVSPANKKSPDTRQAFVTKATAHLERGIGLVIVDAVTDPHCNLHNDLARELADTEQFAMAGAPTIYAASYRPKASEADANVEVWTFPLTIATALPTVPLFLRDDVFVPLDLESTYTETRRRARF